MAVPVNRTREAETVFRCWWLGIAPIDSPTRKSGLRRSQHTRLVAPFKNSTEIQVLRAAVNGYSVAGTYIREGQTRAATLRSPRR